VAFSAAATTDQLTPQEAENFNSATPDTEDVIDYDIKIGNLANHTSNNVSAVGDSIQSEALSLIPQPVQNFLLSQYAKDQPPAPTK
jgi:uncharacterized repeat protein (TIGR01451 family)